jgi:hypothetical protein
MIKWPILPLTAAVLAGSIILACAGVCSDAVESMQARVDARLDAIAGAGRAAPESAGALMHRQPTPNSVAAAEEKLGELSPEKIGTLRAAMARARDADAAGDKAACERALAEAQALIGR